MAVCASTTIPSRRRFLSSLARLPLIGGGVALLGQPTGAAVPVTLALMRTYCDFLSRELMTACAELDMIRSPWRHFGPEAQQHWDLSNHKSFIERTPVVTYICDEGPATRTVEAAPPSTRAAVVLAAAGVSLRAA